MEDAFSDTLNYILVKQEINIDSFVPIIHNQIIGKKYDSLFEVIKTKKDPTAISLLQTLDNYNWDVSYLDSAVISQYLRKNPNSSTFIQDVNNIVEAINSDNSTEIDDKIKLIRKIKDRLVKSLERIKKKGSEFRSINQILDQLDKLIQPSIKRLIMGYGIINILQNDNLMKEL